MPHVDDAHLHACIDGQLEAVAGAGADAIVAHIDACAECRARLEEARAYRDRSGAILAAAGPERVDVPPFEAILARRRAREAEDAAAAGGTASAGGAPVPHAGPGRSRPWAGVAWAASIALALAMGWYAREAVFRSAPQPYALESATSAVGAPEHATPPAPADAPPRSTARAPDAPAAGARAGAEGEPLADATARPDESAARGGAQAGDQAGAAVAAAADTETAAALPARRPLAGAPRPAPVAGRVEAGAARARPVADTEQVADRLVAPTTVEAATMSVVVSPWKSLSREEGERRLGGPLLAVPELEVLAVEGAVTDGVYTVRVRQRLPDGRELELLQRRASPAAAAPAVEAEASRAAQAAKAGASPDPLVTFTVERSGFLVTGRAPLPADSLRALLDRLR